MAVTSEIAPNIYRISIFAQWGNFQFNHFLLSALAGTVQHDVERGGHSELWGTRPPEVVNFRLASQEVATTL